MVISIIALLIGILLPSLGQARETAKALQCANNVRSIAQSLMVYAGDYREKFPQGIELTDPLTGKQGQYWYDVVRLGEYLPNWDNSNLSADNERNQTIGGGAVACPSALQAGRSYSINYWAQSAVGGIDGVGKPGFDQPKDERLGQAWDITVERASDMILVAEAWAPWRTENDRGADNTWFTAGGVGSGDRANRAYSSDLTPGERFAGGQNAQFSLEAEDFYTSQPEFIRFFEEHPSLSNYSRGDRDNIREGIGYVPFNRHFTRDRSNPQTREGEARFAMADGSVKTKRPEDLGTPYDTRGRVRSRYDILWTPIDTDIDREMLGIPSDE